MERVLAGQRCFNHADREAAAQCLECGNYFCRECVTEHEHRMVCAACLAKIAEGKSRRFSRFGFAAAALQMALGVILAWLFFLLVGQSLLNLPSSFHEGQVWKKGFME